MQLESVSFKEEMDPRVLLDVLNPYCILKQKKIHNQMEDLYRWNIFKNLKHSYFAFLVIIF